MKRSLTWIVGVALIIAAVITVREFHYSAKLQQFIEDQAEANGINGLAVGDIDVGLFEADIKDIKLNTLDKWDGEIKVKKVTLHYNPLSVISQRRLSKVVISDARFKMKTDKQLSQQIVELKKLLPAGERKSVAVHIDTVEIDDAEVEIQHGDAEFKLPLSGDVTFEDGAAKFDLAAKYNDDLQGQINVKGQWHSGKLQAEARADKLHYDEDDVLVTISDIKADIATDKGLSPTIALQGKLSKLKAHDYGHLAKPVDVQMSLVMAEGAAPVELKLQYGKDNILLTGTGSIATPKGKHTIKIDMPRRKIAEVWTVADTASELLGTQVQQVDGHLWITGDISYGERLSSDLNVWLTDCNVLATDLTCNNIATKLHISSPWPVKFFKEPVITIAAVKSDVLAMNSVKLFPAIYKDDVRIKRVEANTMGGQAILTKLEPIKVGKHNGYAFALQVRGVEMGQLFQVAQVNGLSGNAKLDGSASARVYGKVFDIDHAKLKSVSDLGLLQYNPTGEATNTGEQAPENLTMEVLKNLHFTRLNVSLKRSEKTSNKLQAKIKITGFNKDVLNGHPFEFNITTTGELDQLIKTSLMDLSKPQDIKAIKELIENQNPRRSE